MQYPKRNTKIIECTIFPLIGEKNALSNIFFQDIKSLVPPTFLHTGIFGSKKLLEDGYRSLGYPPGD